MTQETAKKLKSNLLKLCAFSVVSAAMTGCYTVPAHSTYYYSTPYSAPVIYSQPTYYYSPAATFLGGALLGAGLHAWGHHHCR